VCAGSTRVASPDRDEAQVALHEDNGRQIICRACERQGFFQVRLGKAIVGLHRFQEPQGTERTGADVGRDTGGLLQRVS
jgi:hypothetical protein